MNRTKSCFLLKTMEATTFLISWWQHSIEKNEYTGISLNSYQALLICQMLFDDILLSICQVFNNRLNNYYFCRDFVRLMDPVLGLSSNYWNYRPFLYPSLSIFGFVVCVRLSLNIFQYSTVQIQVLRFASKIDSAHTIVGVFWVLGILDWGICFIIELFVLFSVPVKTI